MEKGKMKKGKEGKRYRDRGLEDLRNRGIKEEEYRNIAIINFDRGGGVVISSHTRKVGKKVFMVR